MGYYKIKNITDLLGKRHSKVNSTQSIEIVDSFKKQVISLPPKGEFVVQCTFLPISIHKLRTEGIVSVIEIDKNTYINIATNQPVVVEAVPVLPLVVENKESEDILDKKSTQPKNRKEK